MEDDTLLNYCISGRGLWPNSYIAELEIHFPFCIDGKGWIEKLREKTAVVFSHGPLHLQEVTCLDIAF